MEPPAPSRVPSSGDHVKTEAGLLSGDGHVGEDWLVSDRSRSWLVELETVLQDAVRSESIKLGDIAQDFVTRPGKRIRPALVFLAGEHGDPDEPGLCSAAAGIELLHVAALCHDDIMDRTAIRRGAPTLTYQWGEAVAAVAGTYLTSRGIELFTSLGASINRVVASAMVEVCTGQLQEAENAYNLDLPAGDHMRILARKTATLFELPCRLGAMLSNVPTEQGEALATFGRHLGVSFQLVDDALDLQGDPKEMGKPTGTDLREGVYSLPILLLIHTGGPLADELRERLGKLRLTQENLRTVIELLQGTGAVAEALRVADRHRVQALRALQVLPEGPARTSLSLLADYALKRSR